jgi:hypothetical protein
MWKCSMCIASQIVGTSINAAMVFQYMNIVLIVKLRYRHMKHLLPEANSTTAFDTSRCVFVEDMTSNDSNRMFSPATDNLKSHRGSHRTCTIQDLQILYSEFYDMLYANNNSYEFLSFLVQLQYSKVQSPQHTVEL